MTTPQTAPAAPMPIYQITSAIPASSEAVQTFGLSSTIGLYEVDSSGAITTIPLGQSGPFTLLVGAEQILCSSLEAGIVTVWGSLTATGRGFGSTTVAAHIASASVSVYGTSSADATGSAPLNSPAFTGVPTAPTASPATNTTQVATTAYADAALGAGGVPVATTVTGPDAFGASAVVGTGGHYSPSNHDHGLPANPVTAGLTAVATLTNKRITKRVLASAANSATPTANTDNYDVIHLTSQTTTITNMSTNLTGTPVDGDTLRVSITGSATGITWGTKFESSTVVLPAITVTTARLDTSFVWNTETTAWRCVQVA